ncbi:hypothetical protein BJF89_01210 [Corynebacterium sp. CNJ-954]|uniref:SHOCT domain-containing protein n=1 Tax=Corynebacterium sp. CNJ-954 TaxID=1904962 RepID=UPI00095FA19D|nr:PH domain-containing protein [Corynebacterium sp. CNJ-954]OLT54881.1 hypothetical protein BJF89_01210 [Corynebacterium sp. CNJ-954]
MAPQHTFRRTLTISPTDAYQPLIDGIPTIKDCDIADPGNPIIVKRKRNMLANRWAMQAAITIDGPELVVTIDSKGANQPKFAEEIFGLLPDGAIDDHGLDAAQARMAKSERVFSRLELHGLLNDLRHGEDVLMLATGQIDKHVAIIAVTTKRIIGKDKGAFDSASREILPKHVSSISTGSKLTGEWIKLRVSGEALKIDSLQHGRGGQIAEHIRKLRDSVDAPTDSTTSAGSSVDDLTKLAELHAAGVLSDDEFTAAKAKALGL